MPGPQQIKVRTPIAKSAPNKPRVDPGVSECVSYLPIDALLVIREGYVVWRAKEATPLSAQLPLPEQI
jgi:hypothetical protein